MCSVRFSVPSVAMESHTATLTTQKCCFCSINNCVYFIQHNSFPIVQTKLSAVPTWAASMPTTSPGCTNARWYLQYSKSANSAEHMGRRVVLRHWHVTFLYRRPFLSTLPTKHELALSYSICIQQPFINLLTGLNYSLTRKYVQCKSLMWKF